MKKIFITLCILLLMTANSFAVSNILLGVVDGTSTAGVYSTIGIVNEDGTPATDTILRNSSNDYKVIEGDCGTIQWSVTGTGGTISSGGILSASGIACGSLTITVTDTTSGLFATQAVRVTDSGSWTEIGGCDQEYLDWMGNNCASTVVLYAGKYQYSCVYQYGFYCWTLGLCTNPETGDCESTGACNNYICSGAMSNISQSPCYAAPSGDCFTARSKILEWVCP